MMQHYLLFVLFQIVIQYGDATTTKEPPKIENKTFIDILKDNLLIVIIGAGFVV